MFSKFAKVAALVSIMSMLVCGTVTAAVRPAPAFTDPNGNQWYDPRYENVIEGEYLQNLHSQLAAPPTGSDAQIMTVGDYRLNVLPPAAEVPHRIYWDEDKFGNFLDVAGYIMTVFGLTFLNIETIVVDVALSLGQGYNDIAPSGNVEASTGHSYTYLVKEGQVMTSSGWQTFYIATSREVVPHTYALYEDIFGHLQQDGLTYPVITTQYSPNHFNHSEISWESLNRWGNDLPCGREDWTGVYPDPDPQFVIPKPVTQKV